MRRPAQLFVACSALFVLAACGIPTEDGATRVDDEEVPAGLLETPQTSAVAETTADQPVAVPGKIYLIEGELLAGVERSLSDATASTLIDSLLLGPTDDEADEGIRSALASDEVVSAAELRGRTMAIDLRAEFTDAPPTEQRLALAQLTFTATEDPLVTSVVFTLEGEAISVPRSDGTTSDGPVQRADYRSLAPAGRIGA